MADNNWQKVREIFDSALCRQPEERQNFVNQACGEDKFLRAEVESLLSSLSSAESFMETPAVAEVADVIEAEQNKLEAGKCFGHYEIIEQIGTGGMGEVYLARDKKLDRQVALKILNEKFSGHESNLQRFVSEAKAASALNHPNILTIYEIGESEAAHFIISEFIKGKTLREVTWESRPGLPEILDISIQIASALSAAHDVHLVHRDIKPENVMIRPDGYVKILDFGLAKLIQPKQAMIGLEAETANRNETVKGVIMGTVNYMSPEQAKGEKVDERTDIFSFGVVVYEMISGRTPFAGNSVSETFANLLNAEPQPLARFASDVPAELQRIVSKMLRKGRDERYQSIKDVSADLKDLREHRSLEEKLERFPESENATVVMQAATGDANKLTAETRHGLSLAASRYKLAAFALVALLTGFFIWKSWQVQTQAVKFLKPSQITTWTSLDNYPSLSPDGNSIAYSSDHGGNFEIYVKPLAPGANEIQLTSDGQQNFQPAFSPDGKFIAFYSKNRGGIWVIPASGGRTRQITTFGSRPAWSADGNFIAFQSEPITDLGGNATPAFPPSTIWTISSQGGEPTQLTLRGNPPGGHGSPAWSPDGRRIVFCASDFLGSSVWTISSKGGDLKQVAKGNLVDAIYAADGESIYYSSNYGLWKIRVSRASGAPVGEPIELANTSPARFRHFTVSADGKKIGYAPLLVSINIQTVPISPASNEATGEPVLLTQNRSFRNTIPSFSPDGKKIAYQSFNVGGELNIWLMEADGKNAAQVTTEGGFCPSWFPDGEQLAFASNRQERWKAWATNLKTGQDKHLLDFGEEDVQYLRLSPDGRQIAFNSKKSGTINTAVISTTSGEARQLTFDKELAGFAFWSPDGKALSVQIKRGEDSHIGVMSSEGGEITQLTFDKGQSWAHSFSPDGDKIVFAGFRDGLWNLYWVSRSTKQQKQLTNYTGLNSYVRYPTWSPLGNQIAFEYAETTGNIWIADLK